MNTAATQPDTGVVSPVSGWAVLRPHEVVALGYFVVLAILGVFRRIPTTQISLLLSVAVAICVLASIETFNSRRWTRVVREWGSLALILIGYWSLGFFPSTPAARWETVLISWDRTLLFRWGFHRALEATGPFFGYVLETTYLLLYAFPTTALGCVTVERSPAASRRFLFVLFLGIFTAYALLPFFPVLSPRLIDKGVDGPSFEGVTRHWNVWLLDHYDNSPGVFPSGHVAVAFACAFGLLSSIPQRRGICITAFVLATVVYVATIYGRYHYAVDGLASIVITALAWRLASRVTERL